MRVGAQESARHLVIYVILNIINIIKVILETARIHIKKKHETTQQVKIQYWTRVNLIFRGAKHDH